ncbi:MAG: DUF2946 family protein [Burkholderiaceae bacterium]|nr:hypothetical protein [Aquabacterium sp.]NUP86986.1 DUF2946 family protein [Burkholderiaceae bacterium]
MLAHTTRRWMSWLALAAITMATLAPGVSRALAADAAPGSPFAVVCRIDATTDGGASSSGDPLRMLAHVLDHCAFCAATGADTAGPPPADVRWALASTGDVDPLGCDRTHHVCSAGAPPPARAPPVRS